jgi:tetratricopeptide (TPR) repeat protein
MRAMAMFWLLALVVLPVGAQQGGGPRSRPTSPPDLAAATAQVLNRAIEALDRRQFDDANAALAVLDDKRLSPYERSRVEQIRFSIAFEAKRFDVARAHLGAAIDAGGLNGQEAEQARYQLAQTYLSEQRWQEGAAALEQWLASVPSPNSAAWYLLAVAYYQMGDYDRALAPAGRAVDGSDAPQEQWVNLLLAVRLQRKEFEDSARLLQRLVVLAPTKKTYWMQLSSVYGQLEDYESAVATLQIAYDAGLLTDEAEIRRYVDLLVFNDLPFRGARVLEDAISRQAVSSVDAAVYEKLANCWIAAREFERAVAPLRRAGELAATGDPFVRLAELESQREDWPSAEAASRRALEKGGLRDAANAELLLGIALVNQGGFDEARAWLESASRSEALRVAASSYLDLIAARTHRLRL